MAQKNKLENIVIQSFITNSTIAESFANGTLNDPLNPTITVAVPTQVCKKNVVDTNNPPINYTKPIDGCNIAPPALCDSARLCQSPDFGYTGKYICTESAQTYCHRVCGSEKNLLYPNCDGGFFNTEQNCTNPVTDRTYIWQCGHNPYESKSPQECTGHNLVCPTGNFHTKRVIECDIQPNTYGVKCGTQMTKKEGYICDQETGPGKMQCPTFDFVKCKDTGGGQTICKRTEEDYTYYLQECNKDKDATGASPCTNYTLQMNADCERDFMSYVNVCRGNLNDTSIDDIDFNWNPIDF